jgi:hypothetical protein
MAMMPMTMSSSISEKPARFRARTFFSIFMVFLIETRQTPGSG